MYRLNNPHITNDVGSDAMKIQRALADHVRTINELVEQVERQESRLRMLEQQVQQRR